MGEHVGKVGRRAALKTALVGLGGIALAPALAACRAANAPPPLSTAPVTIIWSTWGGNTNPMVQASSKGAEAFKKLHPNITVEPQAQLSGWPAKILAQMASGSGAPDLIGGDASVQPDWARKGVLVKLDPFIARDLKQDEIDDFAANQYQAHDLPGIGMYALPMYMGTFALLYNKNRFQAAGLPFPSDDWDWDAWVAAMTKLTNHDKEQWGGYVNLGSLAQEFINQNGGHEVDPSNNLHCVIDSPEALGALQWSQDQMWKSNVAMQPGQAQKGQSSYEALLGGRYATAYIGSWGLKEGGKAGGADAPLLINGDWDVAEVPKGPKARTDHATSDGWAIWKGSPHVAEAWALMQWLETDGWWDINLPITAQQPSRKSLQDKWVDVLKKNNPGFQDKHLEAFTLPIKQNVVRARELFKYNAEARKVLDGAYNTAVLKNKAGVSEAFKAAAAQVNQLEQQLDRGGTSSATSSKKA